MGGVLTKSHTQVSPGPTLRTGEQTFTPHTNNTVEASTTPELFSLDITVCDLGRSPLTHTTKADDVLLQNSGEFVSQRNERATI